MTWWNHISCERISRYQGDISTYQGTPKIASTPWEDRRGMEQESPAQLSGSSNLIDILISTSSRTVRQVSVV